MALNKGLLSVEVRPDGIAAAYSPNPSNTEITVCELHKYQNLNLGQFDTQEFKEYIAKIVSKYHLKKADCTLILHPSYYHLTLVDTPNVSRSEYKKALRWQMKEVVSYPLEDVAIDIFSPGEASKDLKKIYVIASQISFLQEITGIMQECELSPSSIDIHEFSIRNLIGKMAKSDETIGFLSISNGNCILVFIKQNKIQFVRHFHISINNLKNNNYNELTTELQRSFNYCQTELKQEIPSKIFMPPTVDFDEKIAQNIGRNLQKEVSVFNLKDIVDLRLPTDQLVESNCWVAVGGTLRSTT